MSIEVLILKRVNRLSSRALNKDVVYILRSLSNPDLFYIGYTNNIRRRIRQHNGIISGGGAYTKENRPWVLASIIHGKKAELSKKEALRVEYYAKAKNHTQRLQDKLSSYGPVEKRMFLIRKAIEYTDTRCKTIYFDRDMKVLMRKRRYKKR